MSNLNLACDLTWTDVENVTKIAVLAERERCVRIAESFKRGTEPQSSIEQICNYIATQIREGHE